MNTNIKVAGTTFHKLPAGEGLIVENEHLEDGVPVAYAKAILVPEPTNQYDADAVQVVVSLKTGKPFVIGYIPSVDPIKTQIKQATIAKVCIKDYRMVGNYNPSYVIEEVDMATT